jgi:hypothetical protein
MTRRSLLLLALALARPVAPFPALPSPPAFDPSYEWQEVAEGATVPAGLEVRLQLHDENAAAAPPRLARIPPSWRLQVWMGEPRAFARVDVRRDAAIVDVEAAIAEQAAAARRHARGSSIWRSAAPAADAACRAALWSGGHRMPSSATVESARLFAQQRTLTVRMACDEGGPADRTDGAG